MILSTKSKVQDIGVALLIILMTGIVLNGQEITKEDYARAVSYTRANYYNKTAFNLYTAANWYSDGTGLWYEHHSRDGKTYTTIDFEGFKAQALFDHAKLASRLSTHLNQEIKADKLNLEELSKIDDKTIRFKTEGQFFHFDHENNQLVADTSLYKQETSRGEAHSPDDQWIAFAQDYNLYIRNQESNETIQLSRDGVKGNEYANRYGWFDKMEGENGERPQNFQVRWSSDSRWIYTVQVDTRDAEKMYLLDWSQDSLYKPQLLSYYRGSPGDQNMVRVQPKFFYVPDRKEIKTNLPKNTHINPVNIQWSQIPNVIYASYAERGFNKNVVLRMNLYSQQVDTLITEISDIGIDNFSYYLMEEYGKILFLSERSGWRQLYAVDIASGETEAITDGTYYIHQLPRIDKELGKIYFTASATDPTMNPYYEQLYKTDLDGKITCLTPEKLHHRIDMPRWGDYFLDNYSSITEPTHTILRELSSGTIKAELSEADVSLHTRAGWLPPTPFELTAKDGETTIYGALWKPIDFDPSKKYPLIDNSYTGPHTQVFPKPFDQAFNNQALAELGFVVMRVDGLGTAGRSKAFRSHSYKNMGNNLEDHVRAIHELGQRHEWIDTTRVGIMGHSAGGYDTGRGMLAFGDTYKVGVASSADHDFRMEKAWWPEMYQGWPVDSTYHEASNITQAHRLRGKLLLLHGGLDDNVNPSATFKLAEALVRADKEFDLVIFPSQRHGYRGQHRSYFIKKRWNYFIKHLRGEEPIWDFEWN